MSIDTLDVSRLIEEGFIPQDSEIITTHNNLVISSQQEKTVSRIGKLSLIMQRADPGDIRYSHQVAWIASDVAPVVRPVSQHPEESGDIVISTFPLRGKVDWSVQEPKTILDMLVKFNTSLSYVSANLVLRDFDISQYAQERLDFVKKHDYRDNELTFEYVQNMLILHQSLYPFNELTQADPALVHGDLHAGNIVSGTDRSLEIIDLDSAAKGPRFYDLASWRFRHEMGDIAPIDRVVEEASSMNIWNQESYNALIGWKAISSMTHILNYEKPSDIKQGVASLARSACRLGVFDSVGALENV